jgi:hypothetical protein
VNHSPLAQVRILVMLARIVSIASTVLKTEERAAFVSGRRWFDQTAITLIL